MTPHRSRVRDFPFIYTLLLRRNDNMSNQGGPRGVSAQPSPSQRVARLPILSTVAAGLFLYVVFTYNRTATLPVLNLAIPSNLPGAWSSDGATAAGMDEGRASGWYPPSKSTLNDHGQALHGSNVYGHTCNYSSTYEGSSALESPNWCNMPHVRAQEYVKVSSEYELQFVEVVSLSHKGSLLG